MSEGILTDLKLNPAQQQAVRHTTGPMLVVAGAGTGKTRVIVERIKQLIDSGVPADSILALTFTEKAAGEMLERLNSAEQGMMLDVTAATFNGFGNNVLQAYGSEWGLGSLRLLGETGQLVFMREHLDEFGLEYFAPISTPDGQLDALRKYVSLLKQQLVLPDGYADYAKTLPETDDAAALEKLKQQELARFYDTYLQLCRKQQVIDYDDQLYLTIQMLRSRPNILRQLQVRYQYILVDEFQDTNPMQSALIDLLAGAHQNIMVVGDDDQSIYGWRGATLANILDFKQRYPEATEVTLIENYRSTQSILDSAYRLIQFNNPNRLEIMNNLDKRLHAQAAKGEAPEAIHFSTLDAELNWVAEDIAKRLAKGQTPSSIAILARRNTTVEKVHQTLELNDIPHAVAGMSNDLYQETAVKQLLEALKTISDPRDDLALFHTLSGPLFSLEYAVLALASAQARREHDGLATALTGDETAVEALKQIDTWRQLAREHTVGEVTYAMLTDSGWKQRLYNEHEADPTIYTQVQALSKFFKTLKEFERIAGVASVQNYIVNLPTLQAAGSGFEDASLDISDELVNVISVHRSKGLEWDTVYIVDCSEGSFPMRSFGGGLEVPAALQANSNAADDQLAEERRLMYVAATRARQELILTHADRHDSNAVRKPSRFIAELLGHDTTPLTTSNEQTSLELFAAKSESTTIPLPSEMLRDGKLRLSVSQIDCWLRCPQDFYYKYVLQMPLPPSPTLQYGTAIHSVIETIHRAREQGQTPDMQELLEHVQSKLPRDGYASARSRERAHEQAIKTVETVYKRFMADVLPIETEKPFAVAVPAQQLTIIGRIDAVYQLDGGVEIRDFKTGTSVTTPEKAKSRATSSNQLTLYALAWQLLHDEMPKLLTLDFVETGELGSVRKQPKSLDTLTGKLLNMAEQLHAGTYPSGHDHTYCDHPL
ncbi:MAG TPA: ATP-dependent DNA helicase [Candidatus Microsaccharimonas sp.]|nr:ATP-dependent DNA helicase [Candidatus Microsaccharimonas sp.]